MASVTDVYNAILTATQSLNKFTQTFPRPGGTVIAINNLSSTPVSVVSSDPNRNSISFHNPGTVIAYVAPTTQGSSNGTLTPSLTQLGGCFAVMPSSFSGVQPAIMTLSGVVQQAWQAFVSSNSSQPLTILVQ